MSYISLWSGTKCCRNRMDWQIAKGAVVEANTTIEYKWSMNYDGEADRVHRMDLYSYAAENAPDYKHDMGKKSTDLR